MFTSASSTVIRRFYADRERKMIGMNIHELSRARQLGDRLSERSWNHRTFIFLARYFFAGEERKKAVGGEREGGGALSQLIKRHIDRVVDAGKLRCDYLRSRVFRFPRCGICGAIRYPATEIFCAQYIFLSGVYSYRTRQVRYLRARCEEVQVSP